MKGVIEANESNFDVLIADKEKPVLVDFWAEWCGPCRMLGPVIEQIADEMGDKLKVCKLNVDFSPAIAQRFGIMSIPTVLIFKNGEIVDKFVGALPKQAIAERLKTFI